MSERSWKRAGGERRLCLPSFGFAGTLRSFPHTELTKVAIDMLRKLAFDDAFCVELAQGHGVRGWMEVWVEEMGDLSVSVYVCDWLCLEHSCFRWSSVCCVWWKKACDGALYELLWHFYHLWWSLKKTQMFSLNKPMNFSWWVVT